MEQNNDDNGAGNQTLFISIRRTFNDARYIPRPRDYVSRPWLQVPMHVGTSQGDQVTSYKGGGKLRIKPTLLFRSETKQRIQTEIIPYLGLIKKRRDCVDLLSQIRNERQRTMSGNPNTEKGKLSVA